MFALRCARCFARRVLFSSRSRFALLAFRGFSSWTTFPSKRVANVFGATVGKQFRIKETAKGASDEILTRWP